MAPKVKPKSKRQTHPLAAGLEFLFWLYIFLVTASAGISVGAFVAYLNERPSMRDLEYYQPLQVTRVVDRTNQVEIAQFFEEKRDFIPISKMPKQLLNAVTAIEDERFYQHFGVDPQGVLRAIKVRIFTGSWSQGASTITQQLARGILEGVGKEKTKERKVREALAALEIEHRYSKDQILEFYLNHISLGQNSWGVQAAALTYFGKTVDQLTIAECASLAALPKAPTTYNPYIHADRHLMRRNLVIDNMYKLGMIDEATYKTERARPVEVVQGRKPLVRSYFVDHLKRILDTNTGSDSDESNILTRGGYHVISTEDLGYQKIVEDELTTGLLRAESLWQDQKQSRQAHERKQILKSGQSLLPALHQQRLAVITEVQDEGLKVELEGYTGFVNFRRKMIPKKPDPKDPALEKGAEPPMVWSGEYVKPWFHPEEVCKKGKLIDIRVTGVDHRKKTIEASLLDENHIQGAAVLLDVTSGEILALSGGADPYDLDNKGSYNRATLAARQPGSAYKPILYAIAIESGKTAARIYNDRQISFGRYMPRNYESWGDGSPRYYGPTTLIEALAHSRNVVTVELFHDLGMRRSLEGYHKFDMPNTGPKWVIPAELPVCLGSISTTPLSIAAGYLPFARRGLAIEPMCIKQISTLEGKPADSPKPFEAKVISPQTAYIVTRMLQEVINNGTGTSEVGKYFTSADPQMAGKTGTTTDCVDAWFVGYTPELLLVVRIGFDQIRPMGPSMTGSKMAAPVWRNMMKRILATRTDWKKTFDVPSDIVFADISSRTGDRWNPAGPIGDEKIITNVPFIKGTEPQRLSPGLSGVTDWNNAPGQTIPGELPESEESGETGVNVIEGAAPEVPGQDNPEPSADSPSAVDDSLLTPPDF